MFPYNTRYAARVGKLAQARAAIAAGTAYLAAVPGRNRTISGMDISGSGAGARIVERKQQRYKKRGFKNKVLATKQAKHFTGASIATLTHNTHQTLSLTTQVVQGDTIANRDGDEIFLEAVKINYSYQTPSAGNGYTLKILVGYHEKEINYTSFATPGLLPADIYHVGTDANWSPNGIINSKAFQLVHQERVDVNSQIASTSDCVSGSFTCSLNKNFPYKSSGSLYGKFKNLYVIAVASAIGGTAGTTASGAAVVGYDLIFKNP